MSGWSSKPEMKNAVIRSTTLGVEDHGILTFFLHLDYDGSGQGFGGYGLDEPVHENGTFKGRRGTAYGCEAIRRVLEVLGVERWEKLPGTPCRVVAEHTKVNRIGHYLKDQWLDLSALADEFRALAVGRERVQ